MSEKNLNIELSETDYNIIKEHAQKANIEVSQYIKRSLVFLMNMDDLMVNPLSFIKIVDQDNQVLKRISKIEINKIK